MRLLILLAALTAAAAVGFGAAVYSAQRGGPAFELAREAMKAGYGGLRTVAAGAGLGAERKSKPPGSWQATVRRDQISERELAALNAIGYLAAYTPATDSGVVLNDPSAQPGLNFYVSGDAPGATLMQMDGTVVHRWHLEFEEAFPGRRNRDGAKSRSTDWWRRAALLQNGDVVAVFPGWGGVTDLRNDPDFGGMVRVDRDSNLLWALPDVYHHDIEIAPDGRIYALVSEVGTSELHPGKKLIIDAISVLDPDGKELQRVSLLDALQRSPYASLLEWAVPEIDLFHANTIELLDGSLEHRSPAFRRGNVLVSLRNLDSVAVVDLETETVVWALSGQWKRQHQPTMLPNGRMLLFDNLGHRGMSKVVELDPFTQEIAWMYGGDEQNGFLSTTSGSNQRLSNGNTLIIESNAGRAFEVTPEKRIVWEFHNPARAGDDDELVSTLFDLVRIQPERADEFSWIDRGPDRASR